MQSTLPLLEKEQLTPDQAMQLGRLKILLAENLQEWTEAIQACRQTIALDKDGKQADALYLKLGELLYKNGDFHEAQLVLQPFPSKYPDSPLKAAALFLAGKAAQQSNTVNTLEAALTIFQTLGAGTTQFAQAAKIEEASVLLRMGKADQCIAVLDELLSKPLPRYMRLLALSIQADAWVTKEDTHSDTLRKAINLCTEILNTPNLGLAWKFKTLTQRAQFYERLNDQEKALDDYASVLVHTPSGSSANKRRDWHWFYNAGFASIRLMGQAQNWDGALALARKLAQTSGPRAREAAAYARRIQLEHFIWQEDPAETEQPPEMQPAPEQAPQ
ncbi:MAG: tetratricopeptide repeat protein [Akkermansia sp.]|uniref:tetratricopeptide repeat protein n=1 Tax=Akkermansia sp. TaxID=1872421 RepID=UPI00399062B1